MNLKRAVRVYLNFSIFVKVTFTNPAALPAKGTRLTERVIIKNYPNTLIQNMFAKLKKIILEFPITKYFMPV